MKTLIMTLVLAVSFSASAQMGGVTGTLNQIEGDPALQGFQNSYDDLTDEIQDLDKPGKKQPTDSVEKTESDLPASPETHKRGGKPKPSSPKK